MSTTRPRVAFATLGCKVNQSETDLLARQFAAAGYACVDFAEPADVYVLNTCTVTHVADRKSRQAIGQVRRHNPDALIVATGCFASIAGDSLADARTIVVKNRDKERLVSLVEARLSTRPGEPSFYSDPEKYLSYSGGVKRSRATVKVQDGCDSHCTYCIIPRARGRSRSVHPDAVVSRVRALVDEGHAEVVITGVDLGSYGEDADAYPDLGGLLQRVLGETEVARVRISSLEPGDFDASWLPIWQSSRMCRHLHLPLQSGSHGVLKRMERAYSPDEFASMLGTCRQSIRGLTVTTDVMVGFPGEDEQEFDAGLHFIRGLEFDGMHVFKYSQRSGTRAARMPNQVADVEKGRRSELLREVAASGVKRLIERHAGSEVAVVWEDDRDGVTRGLTDTNVRVYDLQPHRPGSIAPVRLSGPFRDGLLVER
jgi:threonylcarbamoyladenosine tRNA methylthiotransferase MtaB